MELSGRIVEEQKNYYLVATDKGTIKTTLKGIIKKQKKRLFVGDKVIIEVFNTDIPEGIIRQLLSRKNKLIKPAVTNIDQIILVNTYIEPALDIEFIERFLFMTKVLNLPTIIVFNKNDLLSFQERKYLNQIVTSYKNIGYSCLITSAVSGENIEVLKSLCTDILSIFAGQSGTGKSTILAKLFPHLYFRTNKLSQNIKRGVHTTTNTTLLMLEENSFIADTPGFSQVQLPQIPEEEVVTYFPDLLSAQGTCKYNNCIHENEPDCSIKKMVKDGDIQDYRYKSYLKIYRLMKERRREYKN